ncbi:AMP-binding protein [Canibacter zhoujuaniae]|uniref:AMP-binding protein n=1 Tax=Canibacter zhoujuaniae TaxID=2708343 RepID=UPI001420681B|nr:AMP-binding protein [Canibacter zhoujuaniae]
MKQFVQVPTSDIAWLCAALSDALAGKTLLMPLAQGTEPLSQAAVISDEVRAEAAVLIRTSGSTGEPKTVALSAAALLENARASLAELGGDGQWLVTLPLNLVSGLGQLVRSHISGTEPVFALNADANEIITRAAQLTHPRRYMSVVPVQLARLLDLAETDATALQTLQEFAAILVGGGPTSLQLRQRAYDLGVNIVRTYGSTETAGGCVYDGVEIGNSRVRIRNGEVQLAGANLALGYLTEDGRISVQDRFITDEKTGVRWYRTGDTGELLGGMLQITGRADRVFISGGVNVSLDSVETVLTKLYGDGSVAAVAVPDAYWGERLVVVHRNNDDTENSKLEESEVTAELVRELGRAATPARFISLETMPTLAGGKPDYQALTALAAARISG